MLRRITPSEPIPGGLESAKPSVRFLNEFDAFKNLHILHNLQKVFVLLAQRAVQVFLSFRRTSTAVTTGNFVEQDLSCMVHKEPIAGGAQTPGQQAGLPKLVAHLFSAVLQSFAAALQNAIDLSGDLSN